MTAHGLRSSLRVPAPRSYEEIVAESRDRFIRDTAEHTMTVLNDDGLYRHLRFQKPGTSMYHYDLVTWPGYLAITGDVQTYVFSRTRDMFEFFGPGKGARGGFDDAKWGINPQYWAEKLSAPSHDKAKRYAEDLMRAHVVEWFECVSEELEPAEVASLREALNYQILAEHLVWDNEYEAHRVLNDFEHKGCRIDDSWEWDMREYDWSFLWCCWAIVWGLDKYRKATA